MRFVFYVKSMFLIFHPHFRSPSIKGEEKSPVGHLSLSLCVELRCWPALVFVLGRYLDSGVYDKLCWLAGVVNIILFSYSFL